MGVQISSRFVGPTVMRSPDGRFEAVLPEPTALEEGIRDGAFERQLAMAQQRVDVVLKPKRRFSWLRRGRA